MLAGLQVIDCLGAKGVGVAEQDLDLIEYFRGDLLWFDRLDEHRVLAERVAAQRFEAAQVRLVPVDEDVNNKPVPRPQVRQHFADRGEPERVGGQGFIIDSDTHSPLIGRPVRPA